MKKILIAVVGIGLIIFQCIDVSWAAWETSGLKIDQGSNNTTSPSSGNIHLYDADEQSAGSIMDRPSLRPNTHLYPDEDNILDERELLFLNQYLSQ